MISACCFIKDCFEGAFCLFESMSGLMLLADEYVILDLGSTDGTLEVLEEIAAANPKVRLLRGAWPSTDAGAFATLANDLVGECAGETIVYHQADEVWHEDLLKLFQRRLERGEWDLSFWRIQYRSNFQRVKWFPHLVHRCGHKSRFNFVGDGMNTDRTWDARICSQYGGEFFPRWGTMGQEGIKPYVSEMILDVSLVGGFRDNIIERRRKHAPFWHEQPSIEGKAAEQWYAEALRDPDWTRTESPYNLPHIMRGLVGKVRYELRPEVFRALKGGDTAGVVGL